jgi:hypothetical protein
LEEDEIKAQTREFCEGDFRETVLKHVKFDMIFSSWSFYILNDKQGIFNKFRFLMSNLLKMNLGDELINQMKRTFKNSSKRFYYLMLDFLMSNVQKKMPSLTITNKKEIFRHLDCEEILPSFMLLYLIFSGLYIPLDRLAEMLRELSDLSTNEDTTPDKEDGARSQKSQERVNVNYEVASEGNFTAKVRPNMLLDKDSIVSHRKRQNYFNYLKEEMDKILKTTSGYFISKFTKCLKNIEPKIASININELRILKQFFDDLCMIFENKYEISTESIKKAFQGVLLEYVNGF